MIDALAKVSPFLAGSELWAPAPRETEGVWLRSCKQPAAAPLDAALRAIQKSDPDALKAAWVHIAPVAVETLARIVEEVRASDPAQACGRAGRSSCTTAQETLQPSCKLYENERNTSLENYRAPLLRCRRDPTFFEYERHSAKLQNALVERAK